MAFLLYAFLFILSITSDNCISGTSVNDDHSEEKATIKCNSIICVNLKSKINNLISNGEKSKLDWWQTNVIYEIYPRSFKDTTGNGLGDLRGIIEKIPYLVDLGIGTVWLAPIFSSSGYDLGYDIKDFEKIDDLMGTMADFEELVTKLHENGIKIILDFVPNHTSIEHEWFRKSVRKEYPYSDFYVWVNAKIVNGTKQVPNNWISVFKGSMWEWNDERQQYYLHQFYKEQPELNFRNSLVHKKMKEILRFWLDKGVDGFRFDAVQYLYERQDLKDAPMKSDGTLETNGYTMNLDDIFNDVKEWRAVLDEYKRKDGLTRLMAVESYLSVRTEVKFYGDSTNPGAHFPLSMELADYFKYKSAKYYAGCLTKFLQVMGPKNWICWTIGNHDSERPATLFGEELVDGLLMMQLLLPGTPVIYYGDELGMTDTNLRVDQYVDTASKMGTYSVREKHRTPFQWDSTAQAGFSTSSKLWLPVNPNYVTVNVESQKNDARSHLKIFKELVKLRQLEVFRSGKVNFYEVSEYVFAFSRIIDSSNSYFVVLNLGNQSETINLKTVQEKLPSKLKVKVASLYAKQNIGEVVDPKAFTLKSKAALVLEASKNSKQKTQR